MIDTLGNQRRRMAILMLNTQEEIHLKELSEWMAAIENDCSRHEVTGTMRRRIYISFIQHHADALDNARLAVYHERDKVLEATALTRDVRKPLVMLMEMEESHILDEIVEQTLINRIKPF